MKNSSLIKSCKIPRSAKCGGDFEVKLDLKNPAYQLWVGLSGDDILGVDYAEHFETDTEKLAIPVRVLDAPYGLGMVSCTVTAHDELGRLVAEQTLLIYGQTKGRKVILRKQDAADELPAA